MAIKLIKQGCDALESNLIRFAGGKVGNGNRLADGKKGSFLEPLVLVW